MNLTNKIYVLTVWFEMNRLTVWFEMNMFYYYDLNAIYNKDRNEDAN